MAPSDSQRLCPDCGTRLSSEPDLADLCPQCLLGLALDAPSLLAEIADSEAQTLTFDAGDLAPGLVLGDRYRLRSLLGRGGMGEVWRAFDLKLRIDVALKALRPDLLSNERALETLRQEVRTAREVGSPNVCRVFDLIEIDGRELVAMEYVDGTDLSEIIRSRGPLGLDEARAIAAQFLAGLQAIHDAGLVHRDLKPENLMLTQADRVVVMDFGIAKGLTEGGPGTIAGTPAYMAPEHARGETVDPRADIFAAGVVLAELVEPERLDRPDARRRLWENIHRQPPVVTETPWAPVIQRAVAAPKERRYPSASALARALEEVTLRAAGDEDLRPYPGLASFAEEDAEYFFGRELEVEELVKRLRRGHLLGLIGASGAGKSSFLRAGLRPALPESWRTVVATPGTRPFTALARALAPELAGDPTAVDQLLEFEDPEVAVALVSRWREGTEQALLVIDQFEELFTQNPSDAQQRFTELLSRFTLEADVRVLLSMRDDFLGRCQPFEALRPILSDLTLLGPLSGSALHRALVQPALRCGYRFEDDELVDEMVSEVSDVRGALPLLAFAASRLWQLRDRERGLLTREAYERIGGVAGALAQHAEATLDSISGERSALVRELFRNLVTSQGTRANRQRDNLLSVFEAKQRDEGARVLDALIDARLLTSYEEGGEGEETRIEIVHESLLSSWPRLVRWQTQDADGTQLRDQLRQAAQMWRDRGEPADLLWTGTSFKEYEIWRDRYPGSLSEGEEAFAVAMTAKAQRRQRRRRLLVASVFVFLLAVLAVVGVSRQQALEAVDRAIGSKLLALAQLELERDSTLALAYATESLEYADTEEARVFALRALAQGPPAVLLRDALPAAYGRFSPDGEWLALTGGSALGVVSRDGKTSRVLAGPEMPDATFPATPGLLGACFSAEGKTLVATKGGKLRIWSVPAFQQIFSGDIPAPEMGLTFGLVCLESSYLASYREIRGDDRRLAITPIAPGGQAGPMQFVSGPWTIDRLGRRFVFLSDDGREVLVRPFPSADAPPLSIGRHAVPVWTVATDPSGHVVAARDASDEIHFWSLGSPERQPQRVLRGVRGGMLTFDDAARRLATASKDEEGGYRAEIWDLQAPEGARPLIVRAPGPVNDEKPAFSPDGRWLITNHPVATRAFWPLTGSYPVVLEAGHIGTDADVAFSSDGRYLFAVAQEGITRWSLTDPGEQRKLNPDLGRRIVVDPDGQFVATSAGIEVRVVPFDGGEARSFESPPLTWALAIDHEGRRIASASIRGTPEQRAIRVWDLDSGDLTLLGPHPDRSKGGADVASDLEFLPDGRLVSTGNGGLRLWNAESGTSEMLAPAHAESRLAVFGNGRRAAHLLPDLSLQITDLETGATRALPSYGTDSWPIAVDGERGIIVTGGDSGTVRVGLLSGGEPHLLLGHKGLVRAVAISPDGATIASVGDDRTVRIWQIPDLSQPPLHMLPIDDLVARLRAVTNLRVVEDPAAPSGWKAHIDPFPGWADVLEW